MQVNALPESSGSGTLLESLEVLSCDTIPRHYRAYIHFWNASDLNIFWFLRLPGDNRDSWDVRGLGRVQEHSVQFSCSVTSDSLRPHESHQARPPCPSSTPGVHPNSSASSRWCHPAISSSVVPFSSCPQSQSGSFPMGQLFAWGGQSIGVSASASVLPKNT